MKDDVNDQFFLQLFVFLVYIYSKKFMRSLNDSDIKLILLSFKIKTKKIHKMYYM